MLLQNLEPRRLLAAVAHIHGGTLAVIGTDGDDRFDFERREEGLAIHYRLGADFTPTPPGPADQLFEFSPGDLASVVRIDVRTGEGNDIVLLGRRVNLPVRVDGGPGNDTIGGGSRDDLLIGGEGDDLIDGNDGLDSLYGNDGDDALFSGKVDFRKDGGATIPPQPDVLIGGRGEDSAVVDGSIFWGSGVEQRTLSGRFGTGLPGVYLANGQIVRGGEGLALRWELTVPEALDVELVPYAFEGTLNIDVVAPDEAVPLGRDPTLPRKVVSGETRLPEEASSGLVSYLTWDKPGEAEAGPIERSALISQFVPLDREPLVGPGEQRGIAGRFERSFAWRAGDELFLDIHVAFPTGGWNLEFEDVSSIDELIFVTFRESPPAPGQPVPLFIDRRRFTISLGTPGGTKRVVISDGQRIVGERIVDFAALPEGRPGSGGGSISGVIGTRVI